MNIRHTLAALLCAACTGFASCDVDPIETEGGKLPDKETIANTYGKLNDAASTGSTVDVLLTEGEGSATKGFYFRQTRPAAAGFTLDARIDPALLGSYNTQQEVERQLLPEANYEFLDGTRIDLAAADQRSAIKRIRFLASGLTAGEYVLPLTVAEAGGGEDAAKTLYYNLTIRQPQMGDHEIYKGEDLFFVFYINTDNYQPLLAQDYLLRKWDMMTNQDIWYNSTGNLINLRTVTLDYEAATGRALLNLGDDMRYVLGRVNKYIRPLQDQNRKVCISIEGSGKGLGFCNLDDAQIADFTAQVKAVVDEYNIDGINLWDRNAGYGKEGMPAMNTTSYPKLIKALREALGTDRLLTLAVYEKPTESFHDVEASGGIAVGDYIDYAWSGYNSNTESPQVLDPWHSDFSSLSAYTQKTIANLDPSKFGCVNFPIYPAPKSDDEAAMQEPMAVMEWVMMGYRTNNIIVFDDLRTNLQDNYETAWDMTFATQCSIMDPTTMYYDFMNMYMYTLDMSSLSWLPEENRGGYNKWQKDW